MFRVVEPHHYVPFSSLFIANRSVSVLMGHRNTALAAVATLALVATACGSADTADTTTTQPPPATTTTTEPAPPTTEVMVPELALEVTGWPTLQGGFHYEGWAIVDGSPVTTGKFNVQAGILVDLDGQAVHVFSAVGIESATAIVITIEPAGDIDDVPASTHFLAGDVSNGTAMLTVDHAAALGTDFSTAGGTFLLATPTDDPDGNELSGIWFIELPGPTASLVLSDLAAGWRYEGWAIIDGQPLSSGTFLSGEGGDDAAPFSGPAPGPPFPGEDYVTNAPEGVTLPTDLSGGTVVISVEPFPDDDPAPFVFKPLTGTAAEKATDHVSYPLSLNSDPLHSAVETISS